MKGRDILKSLTEAHKPSSMASELKTPRPAGSVRALKSELDNIASEAASAKELKASIEREGQIFELEPALVDSAVISDRIPLKKDDQFDLLKEAIRKTGQQVPILVRRNPNDKSRFQAAYGHRRLRVAKELGVKVKAIVHNLSDHQMILAQGQENGPRLDLSFIERALYASRLLKGEYDRDLVCEALGVDKPEVSRLLRVADGIDSDLITHIGPARKIGRPRWLELVKAYDNPKIKVMAQQLIGSAEFLSEDDSNIRFEKLYKLALPKQTSIAPQKVPLMGATNTKFGWIKQSSKGVAVDVEHKEFAKFLQEQLPELIKEFERSNG